MQKVVTMVSFFLIFLGTAVGSMANANVLEGRALLFNNGNPSYSGILAAKAKFEAARAADPADDTASLFLAITKLAAFGLENGNNPAVIQSFRDLYESFGLAITDAASLSESIVSAPPAIFGEYNPPDTIPNGDEFQAFLAGPFLALIDELIGYVDGIQNPLFVIRLTADELGSTTSMEVDYGDVLLVKSFLYTLKTLVLLTDSYDMDALDIHELIVLINADVLQMQRDILDRYGDFLKLKTNHKLTESRTALFAAIDACKNAYVSITTETDEQSDDLFFFGSVQEKKEAEESLALLTAFSSSLVNNQPIGIITQSMEWTLTNGSGAQLGFWVDFENNEFRDGEAWGIGNDDFAGLWRARVQNYYVNGDTVEIVLESQAWDEQAHTWVPRILTLRGKLNGTKDQILNGTYTLDGASKTFFGALVDQETKTILIDFNRIFVKAGNPAIDINHVLPRFDADLNAVPGSFSEPVLGGLLAGVSTNEDAVEFFELEPEAVSLAGFKGTVTCPAYDGTGKIFVKLLPGKDPMASWSLGSTWLAGPGDYTISNLSPGQEIYAYAFWDRDDNGILNYGDYWWPVDETPRTVQAGPDNVLDFEIKDMIPPFGVTLSVMSVHQPDDSFATYYSVVPDNFILGSLPRDITALTIKGPDGNALLQKDDFEFDWQFNEFFAALPGIPAIGTYESSVTAGGMTGTATDFQRENKTVPLPDTASLVPSQGQTVTSFMPVFSWGAVDFDNACYRLEINDQWGNRVYASSRVKGMLSAQVPPGKLQPGQTYSWRVRVTDSENWEDVQNRANSQRVSFTMGQILDQSATPALDLDGWGVVAYSGGNEGVDWTQLDVEVRVTDQDGISSDGSSHTVTIEFPDGTLHNLQYSYSESSTVASYYFYSELAPQDGEYIFRVVDPAGNSAQLTDTLTVKTLLPPKALAPVMEAVVDDTTPTFKWTQVDGANRYRIRIYNMDGSTIYRGNAPDTDTWTIPPGILQPHTQYKYRVEARDAHSPFEIDHSTRYPSSSNDYIRFTTGSETTAPQIDLDSSGVHTWNHPDMGHTVEFWIKVHDAQGIDSIKSVKVRFPDYTSENGHEEMLYLDSQESSTSAVYRGDSYLAVQGGVYTFVAEDHDGHVTQQQELLVVDPLTPPDNWTFDITPKPDGDGTGFHFDWTAVDKAVYYRVEIYDRNNNTRLYALPTTQTQYDLAPGFLKKHELYRFRITAWKEFFDENFDNGFSMPWRRDNRLTRVAVPLTGGTSAPAIDLYSWGAVVFHYPHPVDGSDRYGLGFSVRVNDLDGVPRNIQSVTAAHGDKTWTLNFDYANNDTEAYYWLFVHIDDPAAYTGTYTFEVTDGDGNKAQVADALEVNVLPLPANLKPLDNTQTYGTRPLIEWDRVDGASLYRVRGYNTSGETIGKSDYMEENSYRVPQAVLNDNQTFSYRIRACREDFRQDGVDLDNLSQSGMYALRTQPWIMVRDPDLGAGVLILQVLTGMTPVGFNIGLDVDGDGKVGLAEAIYVLRKEAGMDDVTPEVTSFKYTTDWLNGRTLYNAYFETDDNKWVIAQFTFGNGSGSAHELSDPDDSSDFTYSVTADGIIVADFPDEENHDYIRAVFQTNDRQGLCWGPDLERVRSCNGEDDEEYFYFDLAKAQAFINQQNQ